MKTAGIYYSAKGRDVLLLETITYEHTRQSNFGTVLVFQKKIIKHILIRQRNEIWSSAAVNQLTLFITFSQLSFYFLLSLLEIMAF